MLIDLVTRRETFATILTWLGPLCLGAGLAAGTFSFPIPAAWPSFLHLLAEPRLILLVASLLIGLAARTNWVLAPEAACLLGLWTIFAGYAITRSILIADGSPDWSAFKPVVFTMMSILATLAVVDTPRQAKRLGAVFAVILIAVALSFMIIEATSAPPVPIHGFYASRTFFAGAVVLCFVMSAYRRVLPLALISTIGAIVLIYAGLMSGLRASLTFYALALGGAIILLLAGRQFRAVVAVVLIASVAYGAHFATSSAPLQDKFVAYSPLRTNSFSFEGDATDCNDRMLAALGHKQRGAIDRYSCQLTFRVYDIDARIRLMLQALESNSSPLLGSGLGAYQLVEASRAASEVVVYRHPHNIFAEVYHATGIVGTAIVVASIIVGIAIILRASFLPAMPLAVLSAIPFFSGLAALVGGDLYDARGLWITPFILAVLAEPSNPKGSSTH